jgi:hypothetical protein
MGKKLLLVTAWLLPAALVAVGISIYVATVSAAESGPR